MKKHKIIVLFLLSSSFVFGSVTCKPKNNGEGKDTGNITVNHEEYATEYGSDKTLMLVEGKASNYKIVIPEDATPTEVIAGQDLQNFIELSTTCKLEIVADAGLSTDKAGKYISVGDTKLLAPLNIEYTYAELGDSGFKMALDGNRIFLNGATEEGTLYAVYEFLNREIGFEAYTHDEIYYNKLSNVGVVKIGGETGVETQKSAIDYRLATFGDVRNIEESRYLRLIGSKNNGTSVYGQDWGIAVHSMEQILPVSTYKGAHPDWYNDKDEVCISNDGSLDTIVENLGNIILGKPNSRFFELGHGDNHNQCTCNNCKSIAEANGGYGGLFVIWLNKIGAKIETWLEARGVDREIYIVGLAYHQYETDPGVFDGTEYKPYNQNVVCRDNVAIRYAPIRACYAHAFDDPNCAVNVDTGVTEELKGWAACCDKLFVWLYSVEYYDSFFYFNDMGALSGDYKLFQEVGVYGIKDECHLYNAHSPFAALKIYLRAKLAWDPTLDQETLYNNFMNNYFKDAASAMNEYYQAIRAHFVELALQYESGGCFGFNGIGNQKYMNVSNWSMDLLQRLQKMIDKAYAAVETSACDEETREKLWWRVRLDEIFLTHWYVNAYSEYFTTEELNEIKVNFERDKQILGIVRSTS